MSNPFGSVVGQLLQEADGSIPYNLPEESIYLESVRGLRSELDSIVAGDSGFEIDPSTIDHDLLLNFDQNEHFLKSDVAAADVTMAVVSSPTFSSVQHMQDIFHSAGWVSGGVLSDAGGGDIDVSAGTGLIRATDSSTVQLLFFDWAKSLANTVTDGTARFFGVEYNAGSPQVVMKNTDTWDYTTDFPLGSAVREGAVLHISQAPHDVGDHANFMIQRMFDVNKFQRDNQTGGLILGESADTNMYITVSAGNIWSKLTKTAFAAFDSDPGGGADTFDTYKHISGTLTLTTGVTQWPNTQYDDGSDLVTMDNNKFANLWFYGDTDGEVAMVYGVAQYNQSALAELEEPPSTLPMRIQTHSFLLGRLTFKKSDTTATQVDTVFETVFLPTQAATHSNLSGLTVDDHTQYTLADGTRAFTGNIGHGGFNITNVGALAGTLSTVTQNNVTTMTGLTTIGTLVAGAVPASLVTAGTFGTGAYVFDNTVSGITTLTATTLAGTLSTAAQGNVTSLGTLTALQVDNININGNTISSTAGVDLFITPLATQQLILDGTIIIDAGVLTGGTSFTVTTFIGALTGNAATATKLLNARTIGGVSFNGTANIVPTTIVVADTTDATCFVGLWESPTGDLAPKSDGALTYNAATGALTATSFSGTFSGNAATATALETARDINGVSFDGTANITVTADANTLTNTTLKSTVVTSSLTTVAALNSGSITSGFGNIDIGASTLDCGILTVTGISTFNATQTWFVATNPQLVLDDSQQAVDDRVIRIVNVAEEFRITARDDANSANADIGDMLTISRNTGAAVFAGTGAFSGAGGQIVGITSSLATSGHLAITDSTGTVGFGIWNSNRGFVGTISNHEFVLRSNNTARVTIEAGGNVVIVNNFTVSGTVAALDMAGQIDLNTNNIIAGGSGAFSALDMSGNIDLNTNDIVAGGAAAFTTITASTGMIQGSTSSAIIVSGGSTTVLGANIVMYGESHATQAKDIEFRSATTVRLFWDESALKFTVNGWLVVTGAFEHTGSTIGLFGASLVSQRTVTGSRDANAALASLLTALDDYGIIVNSSSV